MRFIFALVAATALVAAPAMAADDAGFYVGAGIGYSSLDVGSFSGSDTGFRLLAGYQFMKYFAVEAEYVDGGSPDDGGLKIDLSGFNLSAMGMLPLGEQFDLYAKLGMIWWDAKAHGFGKDSGEDFSWAVGAGYSFTDQFGVRLEYQGFEIEDTDTADLFSIAATWKF